LAENFGEPVADMFVGGLQLLFETVAAVGFAFVGPPCEEGENDRDGTDDAVLQEDAGRITRGRSGEDGRTASPGLLSCVRSHTRHGTC
jgi:hypothetical protein